MKAYVAQFIVNGFPDFVHAPFDNIDEGLEVEIVPSLGYGLLGTLFELVASVSVACKLRVC